MDNSGQSTGNKENLQANLQRIRQQSIEAARRGDFRLVAKLTLETARLNAECNEPSPQKGASLLSLL